MEDEARDAAVEKAKAIIEKAGGTITDVEDWGKKRLAYGIKDCTEGFYELLYVTCEPACVAECDRVMKITDGILKHMIVKNDEE